MAIVFYCHRCNKRGEFENKKDMRCDCGHYVDNNDKPSNYINMRKTLSGTTKMEFNTTTIDQSVKDMNK